MITDRSKQVKFKRYKRAAKYFNAPSTVVLHHTVSGSVTGTESYLSSTIYGYHYMIGKRGNIFQYVDPGKEYCNHAKGANANSIGVSFVCGGNFGPVNDEQLKSCVKLINHLTKKYNSIKKLTGHKDVSPGRKIDPRFDGEPSNGVDLIIHKAVMRDLADKTNLKYEGGK